MTSTKPNNFDVICVGNAKIDIFLTLAEADNCLCLIEETNELCIKYGEKISVDKAEALLGGNAANVAVGASRLGLNVGIVAEIGKDEFAQKIIDTLSKEKVDTFKVLQREGQECSFSTIINFKGERIIFSEHVKRPHDFNLENVSTKWVYLTSLGEEWVDAYNKIVDFVKKTNCRLAFNPGTLQIAAGKKSIENVLFITDVLFVNKQEAMTILNIKNQISNMSELLLDLQKLGPKVVVITDGKNGSFVIDALGNISKKGIVKTKEVEKTGAGDAYSSGFLSVLINNKSINDAMDCGTKNSASVISKTGAQAGLLYKTGF